jgi:hypothetical protein
MIAGDNVICPHMPTYNMTFQGPFQYALSVVVGLWGQHKRSVVHVCIGSIV